MSASAPVRIGDQERDQAAECLREHIASGRLDAAEFDERLGAALSARYATDLEPLFGDLPLPHPAAIEPAVRIADPAPATQPTEDLDAGPAVGCGGGGPPRAAGGNAAGVVVLAPPLAVRDDVRWGPWGLLVVPF